MYTQSDLKELVDKAIFNIPFNTEAQKLIDPVRYVLSMGGKRLRPVLALMACNLYTDKVDEAIVPVTGLELFHNFTLVHDDIMDQAPVRRSFVTVHNKWNTNQAILSGDVMAFMTNECFLHTSPELLPKVMRAFNKAAIEVCIGQQLDMDYEKAAIVSREEYLRMIELKTAVLIAASAKIGALFGGADEKDAELLYDFGRNLGLAFQIQDDLLDAYGDSRKFGKAPGGDIVANKKTFLYVKALEVATAAQRNHLKEVYASKDMETEQKISAVMELYDQLNIREMTEILAFEYINTALRQLEKVSVSQERKQELIQLTGSLIGRDR
ncbi:MAG: polyprenyl synthetase family protein [Bacteroidales bacterium]|jgi:geranylgeranyl diphosphate synthase type II|nr:polyprenyl synthetase family protein [Bacteroidales bacterium]